MSDTPLAYLEIDDATRAILARAGIAHVEPLVDLVLEGKVQTIKGIGAGRAAEIADAVSAWGANALVATPTRTDAAPDLPGAASAAADGPDQDDAPVAPPDDPAEGLTGFGPRPTIGPSQVATPAAGATTFQGRGARYREVRVRVAEATADTRQFWFVREGLAGEVVDAFEVVYVPANRTTPVRVYILADPEARAKFVEHGGSSRFGHRELAIQAVIES